MTTTEHKNDIIKQIQLFIENTEFDIPNELNSEQEILEMKLDLDSSKAILGHLLTLKTL